MYICTDLRHSSPRWGLLNGGLCHMIPARSLRSLGLCPYVRARAPDLPTPLEMKRVEYRPIHVNVGSVVPISHQLGSKPQEIHTFFVYQDRTLPHTSCQLSTL